MAYFSRIHKGSTADTTEPESPLPRTMAAIGMIRVNSSPFSLGGRVLCLPVCPEITAKVAPVIAGEAEGSSTPHLPAQCDNLLEETSYQAATGESN